MDINEKKICFIICTNEDMLLKECVLYIKQLTVPKGYEIEIIPIYDAVSMASGYNEAMKKSDAKYKIYLHQDVLIIEKDFISKVLKVFNSNAGIGMIGMVGNRTIASDGCPWSDGMHRRVGEIYADLITQNCYSLFSKAEKPYEDVVVVDGLLMATQYDLPWREELFKGWDFYDCSQALEFIKAGYRVVVPYMEKPWCFHDNDILNMNNYEKWRQVFEREYKTIYYKWTDNGKNKKMESNVKDMKKAIYQVFTKENSLLNFPYPPISKEENTDYICFTDAKEVFSHYWKVEYIENISEYSEKYEENPIIRQKLSGYDKIYEIKPSQIIVGNIFEKEEKYSSVIDIMPLDKLPGIDFNLNNFVPTKDQNEKYIYKKNPVYSGGKYEGREYILTIGVPVSNQIKTIDRCLSNIKPLLENLDAELVVVDTGSTDGTIEVCKKYGARVIEFPWCDNMSAARNTGIYNAKGLWYMSIDDDEWFNDVDDIITFFKSGTYKKCNVATYIQRNYLYRDADVFSESHAHRMAKITPELHFEGRIHDCIITDEKCTVCQLKSVANHYGFLRDDDKKLLEKYKRNTGILLYDVYEYPQNLRYNFQLANEMGNVGYYNEAIAYFYRGLSIEMENHDEYFGRQHAANLLATYYNATSERIFYVTEMMLNRYPFTAAEKAFFHYNLADIGLRYKHNPTEIIENYKKYVQYRKEYEDNPIESQMNAYVGVHVCNNQTYIVDSHVIAFCAYCRNEDEDNAILELEYINPTEIFDQSTPYIEEMLRASSKVFDKTLGKIDALQCELWIEEFTDAFTGLFENEYQFEVNIQRLYEVLKKLSIKSTECLGNKLWERLQPVSRERVCESILSFNNYEEISLQGLYFASVILKKSLADRSDMGKHMDVFFKYVQITGSFAEEYYSETVLSDDADTAMSGDERAAYDIYISMSYMESGASNKVVVQMVERLRHALKSFPGFKTEISQILNTLTKGI